MGEKLCSTCGQWSTWNQNPSDRCVHCGETLGQKELDKVTKRENHIRSTEENWMFFIRESDPAWKVHLKKIGNFFYTIFMAIISFILWFIAAFPG
ncbi:hypothetical protein [Algoriphagus sanaruensis]|uniref:Uncharacterized protein n=1 Tax=Algoriphagus sanaruensis TaxID=1727163 RepID=A0A142EQA7_9BACT|nr:hypothetical protein [Algoriphagus sanaruensis]AMQ57312.1 hypothetical protein AO498_12770 [Algoriphagus sanaruensis]